MSLKHSAGNLLKTAVCFSAAGMLLGASCGAQELNAVVAGIEAAAVQLNNHDRDDDVTFGEWLLSELDD